MHDISFRFGFVLLWSCEVLAAKEERSKLSWIVFIHNEKASNAASEVETSYVSLSFSNKKIHCIWTWLNLTSIQYDIDSCKLRLVDFHANTFALTPACSTGIDISFNMYKYHNLNRKLCTYVEN